MSREFEITDPKNDWLFRDKYMKSSKSTYVAYRHLIEHALFNLIQQEYSKEKIKKQLIQMLNKFNNEEDIISSDIPLKIYFLKSEPNHVVVVDKTKCCFPLVCNAYDRSYGFGAAIKNINDAFEEIFDVLLKNKDGNWSKSMQDILDNFDNRSAA